MMVKALIRKFWKPLLAILATCALGIAVMVGMSGGCLSLQQSTEDYLATHHYYDASITTEVTTDNLVDDLESVEGVSRVNARMVANTVMIGPNHRILSIRAITYGPDDWQRFVMWESTQANGRDSVMVECEFAQDNGIKAGDEDHIRVDGSYRTCVVGALVSAPETLSVRALDNQSPHNSDFGAVYVPINLVAREQNREYEDAKEEIERRESELDDSRTQASQTYDQALEDLKDARIELEQRMQEARESLAMIADARIALDEKEDAIRIKLSKLAEKESKLSQAHNRAKHTIEKLSKNISMLKRAQGALSDINAGIARLNELTKILESDQVLLLVQILRKLNPNTKLSELAFDAEMLSDFQTLREEYGIDPDDSLLDVIDIVEADCQTLHDPSMLELAKRIERGDEAARESKEGKALAQTVGRYTGKSLTEKSLLLAAERCQRLQDLVVENDLRTWAERLLPLADYTDKDQLSSLMDIDDYVEQLRSVLGNDYPKIVTVGQLLDAYDQLPMAIKSAREQLETKHAKVASKLADAGVDEDELPDALEQLRSARHEVQGRLAQVDAGIEDLADLHRQAIDALATIDETRLELDSLEAQAQNGLTALDDLSIQMEAKHRDAKSQWLQGLVDFSNLRRELDRARAELGSWEGYDAFHNQFLLWFDEGVDYEQTLAAACAALDPVEVKSSFSYEDSPVKTRLDNNVVPLRTLSYYLPALFLASYSW